MLHLYKRERKEKKRGEKKEYIEQFFFTGQGILYSIHVQNP